MNDRRVVHTAIFERAAAIVLFFAAFQALPGRLCAQTELGAADDLTVVGADGTPSDPDVEVRGFSVFGATQAAYAGAAAGPGNVVINGVLAVSSGAYFVGNSTFTGANRIFINDGSAGQVLSKNSDGALQWTSSSALGDNLGSHIATTTLNMATFNIINVSSINFLANVLMTSATAAQLGGFYVSSNVYIVGVTSAAKYYGDGSALTGIGGAGSGFNADLLDSLDSLDFVRKTGSISESITGPKTFVSSITVTKVLAPQGFTVSEGSAGYGIYPGYVNIRGDGAAGLYSFIDFDGVTARMSVNNVGNAGVQIKTSAGIGLTVNSLGNVGVGANNPMANLHVSSTTASATQDMVKVTTGGVSADVFVIKGNGDVGIGTMNPKARLHLVSNSTADSGVFIASHAIGGYGLFVSTNGSVGIGLEAPGERLEVDGHVKLTNVKGNASAISIQPAYDNGSWRFDSVDRSLTESIAGAPFTAKFGTNESGADLALVTGTKIEAMRIGAAGNVGISSTSPSQRLTVSGGPNTQILLDANGTGGGYHLWSFGVPVGSINAPVGQFNINVFNGRDFTLNTAAAERLRITEAGGDVGISTNAPAARLDVKAGGTLPDNMAQIWRKSDGVIVGSMSATGVLMAARFVGDGSGLTNLAGGGDNLGSHVATTTLNMATFNIINIGSITANAAITIYSSMTVAGNLSVSTVAASGNITAARYQINGSTVLAVLPGTGSLGIGIDAGKLSAGNYNFFAGQYAGQANGAGYDNSFLGYQAGKSNDTGWDNTFVGYQAGYSNSTARYNTFVGASAGYNTGTGRFNSFFGQSAGGSNSSGEDNTFMGHWAGLSSTSGGNNTFVGSYAGLYDQTGSANAVLGYQAGNGVSGNSYFSSSTLIGYAAGAGLTTGNNNIFVGWQSGLSVTSGAGNIVIGYAKDAPTPTSNNYLNIGGLIVGDMSLSSVTIVGNAFSVGGATLTVKGGYVGIGTTTPNFPLDIASVSAANRKLGMGGVQMLYYPDQANFQETLVIGNGGGSLSHSSGSQGYYNTFAGIRAGNSNSSGQGNSFFGAAAGQATNTGAFNAFLGTDAGYSNISGGMNTAIGTDAGFNNQTGAQNVVIGMDAGFGVSGNSYSNNIFIGFQAANSVTTGGNNIVIGYDQDISAPTAANELNIGGVLYGNLSAKTIGISTNTPQAALDVVSTGTLLTQYAQIWRASNGTVVASMTATGVLYPAVPATDNTKVAKAGDTMTGQLTISGSSLTVGGNISASTIAAFGSITAARYQINGSTVLAILGGIESLGVGPNSGRINQGDYNVFAGQSAGNSNVGGGYNSFLGAYVGSNANASYNSFFGAYAGFSATGGYNTFLGADAGRLNTTGWNNSFVGYGAGKNNTTGRQNSFLGYNAGWKNSTGWNNSGFGAYSTLNNQAGWANAVFGYEAGYGVDTYSFSSSTLMGYRAGYGLSTGSDNILLGFQAGDALITGARNIIIGYDQDASAGAASNELNIGGVLYGDLSAKTIGISTRAPQAALDIVSTGTLVSQYAQVWRDSTGLVVASMTANGKLTTLQILPGDNLGNHTATQNLDMASKGIIGISSISASGICVSSYGVIQTAGPGLNNITGNPRGAGAVDLQTYRTAATQVASGDYSRIVGGQENTASGAGSAVISGEGNVAAGYGAVAGGMGYDFAGGDNSIVLAAYSTATAYGSFIGGGEEHFATADYAAIIGGFRNRASKYAAVVSGGAENIADGLESGVFGGRENSATGDYSTVPGGYGNTAAGQYSFAAGYFSSSTANGAFTWNDGDNLAVNSALNRTWFKSRGGFLVTGSTNPVMTGALDRGMLVTGSGLVGISTGVPYAALDVVSTGTLVSQYAQVWRDSTGLVVASMTANGKLTTLQTLPGDNLGNHTATEVLKMGAYGVNTSSHITAAAYQINGSTVAVILPGWDSIAYGVYAGTSNITGGDNNTFIGNYAATSNTTGNKNTVNGAYALYANTTGNQNTANGAYALRGNTTGGYNTANGAYALYSNTTGGDNTADGQAALYSNTTGGNNTANGESALYTNTTGSKNVAVGYMALRFNVRGSANAVMGYQAGQGPSSNSFSSATLMGYQAGYGLTTGSDNIFLGWKAGYNVTTGTGNLVIGYNQLAPAANSNNFLNIGGVLYGDLSAKTIGISTRAPQAALDIVSTGTTVNDYAQIWRNSAGTIVSSMTATGVLYPLSSGGDNLGNHTATEVLKMGAYGVNTSSHITAAAYQINGSTVLAILPGTGSFGVGSNTGMVSLGDYNVFVGESAGMANIWGEQNTYVGSYAGYASEDGYENTFIGTFAGTDNTTGGENAFVGGRAGLRNTTGWDNSFLGAEAGSFNTTGGANSFFGAYAGQKNTTGHKNSIVGLSAGNFNQTGSANAIFGAQAGYGVLENSFSSSTIMGYQAGYGLTTGSENVFVGFQSGFSNTTGNQNLFLGNSAGYSNTTGTDNSFEGYNAGYANTTGYRNSFIGSYAGHDNTTGASNVFVGYEAGYSNTDGSDNSFFGLDAGVSNTTGYDNTFLGYYAGVSNDTGINNTFVGATAGGSNITGHENSFLGAYAGNETTTGSNNSFLGYQAGYYNTTGNSNSIFGYTASYSNNKTGSANAIFGSEAGYGVWPNAYSSSTLMGYRAGYGLTTGSDNIFLGFKAGYSVTTGTGNIIIGYNKTAPAAGTNNYLNIGGLVVGDLGQSSVTINGNLSAARYQINGSTVLAVLPGSGSLGIGVGAGIVNSAGYNIFVGLNAGRDNSTGASNAFVGSSAGKFNTTGGSNSFFGESAGLSNTTGNNNTFLGYAAGSSNVTGINNSFVGTSAGLGTTGSNNSFMGYHAGYDNITGSNNSIFGSYALGDGNKTGSANAIFGNEAGYGVWPNSFSSSTLMGYQAGYGLTTGSDNIFLGFKAGYNVTSGTGNIIIGYNQNPPAAATSNFLNIGNIIHGALNASSVTINGTFFVPKAGTTASAANAYIDAATGQLMRSTSSRRYKKDILGLDDDFFKILKVRAKSFNEINTGRHEVGFIAEEFDAAGLKDLVVYDAAGRPDAIKYDRVPLYLLEVIKAQQARIEAERAKSAELAARVDRLERKIGLIIWDKPGAGKKK
ncbi:MAG: hypothetical protein HY952_08355 [Elusimicrobia bacterium]|nr:hypothetical protein [Elusimicrobiota bacterium]